MSTLPTHPAQARTAAGKFTRSNGERRQGKTTRGGNGGHRARKTVAKVLTTQLADALAQNAAIKDAADEKVAEAMDMVCDTLATMEIEENKSIPAAIVNKTNDETKNTVDYDTVVNRQLAGLMEGLRVSPPPKTWMDSIVGTLKYYNLWGSEEDPMDIDDFCDRDEMVLACDSDEFTCTLELPWTRTVFNAVSVYRPNSVKDMRPDVHQLKDLKRVDPKIAKVEACTYLKLGLIEPLTWTSYKYVSLELLSQMTSSRHFMASSTADVVRHRLENFVSSHQSDNINRMLTLKRKHVAMDTVDVAMIMWHDAQTTRGWWSKVL